MRGGKGISRALHMVTEKENSGHMLVIDQRNGVLAFPGVRKSVWNRGGWARLSAAWSCPEGSSYACVELCSYGTFCHHSHVKAEPV